MSARWYQDNQRFGRFVDRHVDAARDRPFFDGDAIATLRDDVRSDASGNIRALSAITTVEHWLEEHFDGVVRAEAARATQPTR